MGEKDCPHSQEIGALQAQLYSLKERVEAVEKTTTDNANQILIGLAEDKANSIWIDRMARLIGYAFIIGVLAATGKVIGIGEIVMRLLKL